MQLGDLDRRIRIEQYTDVADSWGQRVPVWSTLTTCWAKILYESTNETYQAEQKVAVRIVKFIVRYNSTYKETLRIIYDSDVFDVIGIAEEIGRERFQVLRTVKKDNLS